MSGGPLMLDAAAIASLVRQIVREELADALARGGTAAGAKPLMTVAEVAALLCTTAKAIYHRIERGTLPGVVYDGDRILVRRADLLRSLAEGRGLSPRSR